MDKFSKLMGVGSWFTKWIPPPQKVRTKPIKRCKISNFGTQFHFPTSLSQRKTLEVKFSWKIMCMGLLKIINEHFFSSKIHLHVGES
jgi:hypothetical protein